MSKDNKFRTMIGGQALIEGIMMRGPDKMAYVVRTPNGLQTKEKKLKSPKEKFFLLRWPLIRGVVNFGSSMAEGMRAISWSAEFFVEEDEETPAETESKASKFSLWLDKVLSSEKAQKVVMTIAMAMGLILGLGLFMLLPAFLTGLFKDALQISGVVRNLVEALVRLIILLTYMVMVSRIKDIKRVFAYHGAEHKTIACYEAGAELTVDNVRGYSRFHPRCGTSFLFMVVFVSILVFSIMVPFDDMLIRVASRLLLLPVVVAITYELNRFIGRHDNWLTRFLRAPGLWMQRLTTNEPDDSMIEVGLESLKMVLPDKEGADEWGRNN